ncbi:hypothetical protein [Actinomadura rubrisoli]|uniref:Uncharacterized protein n=1 Tax=Actinomadura rubrisoli TaxID=2530368 RepID=A0A4R5C6X9_9ACTN|nr:hypothetical protein [Actinomadura rubrisoli]TDD93873.1 hypothetical protein E1298_08245 [Actinomadura rubrisoli]
MEPVPIRSGAQSPRDRQRHTRILARLAAVAGLAFAGWLVLAAFHDTAFAAGNDPGPGGPASRISRTAAERFHGGEEVPSAGKLARLERFSTVRHFAPGRERPVRRAAAVVAGDVHEVGEHPMSYVRVLGHDALDDKDRAARAVKTLASSGVRSLPLAGARPDGPIGRPVLDVAASPPVLDGGLLPQAHTPSRPGWTGGPLVPSGASGGGDRLASVPSAGPGMHGLTGSCRQCRGEHPLPGVPSPVLPSGQDNPGSGSLPGGGHPFGPVAALRTAQHAAAPPAIGPAVFHRTALADMAAPGSPAVVPD